VIDIYRRKIEPEKNLGIFALYISAFPQLIAGPIERAEHLIPQLKKKFSFARVPLREASFLILTGYIKKLVIADNLGLVVDQVYASPGNYESPVLLIATLFFGFQIYADFSGYVDIARGLGKLLGINFVINFNKPYFSLNISEFWGRWHISLSSWVKDYIYIPLGGNRKGEIRQLINLVLTMAIMGLWHGAGFPFLLWGIYHGMLLALHKALLKFNRVPPFPNSVKILITFLLVNVGWILFRSETLQDTVLVFRGIFHSSLLLSFQYIEGMILGITLILILVLFEILDNDYHIGMRIQKAHPLVLGILYALAIHLLLFFGIKQSLSFIYFQF
jgi:alginate O-acetyltransferase complex protein AlgI